MTTLGNTLDVIATIIYIFFFFLPSFTPLPLRGYVLRSVCIFHSKSVLARYHTIRTRFTKSLNNVKNRRLRYNGIMYTQLHNYTTNIRLYELFYNTILVIK